MKYKELSTKYPKFVYEKYSYRVSKKNLNISFDFRIEPRFCFTPKVIIKNIDQSRLARIDKEALNNLIFHLGLVEIPSYWKATCSPEIEIKAGPLNKEQIKWWKNLIINGMGQFFYENKINFRKPNFLNIKAINGDEPRKNQILPRFNLGKLDKAKALIPVGGGKDSVVTLEILKRARKKIRCFSLNPIAAAQKVMKSGGCKNPIIIKREVDPKLLALNRRGFLNGHTPFSAYLAFLSVLISAIFDYKYIAFSNEQSSNEGNVKYLGKIINHQWSKSFEFEKLFRVYSKKYLIKDVEYFSILRPLYEIQIVKLFSKFPKYFPIFLSCNEAYKTDSGRRKPTKKWCGKCPKCLFIFACLYPFIGTKKLIKIFGKNLFEDKKLLPLMLQLTSFEKFKPFECVGTKKETLVAFYLSLSRIIPQGFMWGWKKYRDWVSVKLPYLLKYFEKKILSKHQNLERDSKRIMNSWNNKHNLSRDFEKILRTTLDEL